MCGLLFFLKKLKQNWIWLDGSRRVVRWPGRGRPGDDVDDDDGGVAVERRPRRRSLLGGGGGGVATLAAAAAARRRRDAAAAALRRRRRRLRPRRRRLRRQLRRGDLLSLRLQVGLDFVLDLIRFVIKDLMSFHSMRLLLTRFSLGLIVPFPRFFRVWSKGDSKGDYKGVSEGGSSVQFSISRALPSYYRLFVSVTVQFVF